MTFNRASCSSQRFVEFRIEDTRQTIAERFEQQARRYPERLAVKTRQQALTYAELNRAANRVAHAILRRAGRAPAPVAVYCPGGLSTIIASLGALKAGKAFAPLDGRLPLSRAREVLALLGTPYVLTDREYAKSARELAGGAGTIINIDRLSRNAPPDDPTLAVSPDATAYIAFTSGSTGEPKGVVWNHRSELFGIRTKTNALRIAPADRVSLLRAGSVGATRDMLLALLNGAALCAPDLDETGLAAMARWLRDERITVFSCVATVFRHAVQGLQDGAAFPAVRLVHIGGEPVFKSDIDLYKRFFADRCLFVCRYSISETQAVSYFFIDKQSAIDDDRVPVGYPLEGNDVVILDDGGKAVGPGEIGEIAVRSPYLAAGYWRRPELTRAKFLADPSHGETRTYLTGDLGYRMADGCLVHVGRKDFQTKIRGHRVEVTAIEAALHEIPSIKQAAVIAQRGTGSPDRLVAYVATAENAAANRAAWRAHLKARLPAAMMPAAFVVLKDLPVTAGGKIDRRSLPSRKHEGSAAPAPHGAPQSPVEKVLARFWRDALKIDPPGVQADFADLGGDSLQAAQIAARIQDLFSLAQPLPALAQVPTIEQMARFIGAHEKEPGQSAKIAEIFLRVEALSDAGVEKALAKLGDAASDG